MSEKKQVKFWAEPDVYDWLQSQPNMTRVINELVRERMYETNSQVAPLLERITDKYVELLGDLQEKIESATEKLREETAKGKVEREKRLQLKDKLGKEAKSE